MKNLIFILLLIPISLYSQMATIKLVDGTAIVNAPSGRSWIGYEPTGFQVFPEKDTLFIDDSSQDQMTYYGNWRISTTSIAGPTTNPNNCNCSWSQSPNDSIVFKFTNAIRFEWFGEQMSHHGIAEVYLNGVKQATIDTYSPENKAMTINWSIDNLDTAQVYTFKLVGIGTKNAASTGVNVVNHGFRLINVIKEPEVPSEIENPVVVNGITITASGYQNQPNLNPPLVHPPAMLMDGDLKTKWAAEGEQWVVFKLPSVRLVQSVDIAWYESRANYFGLQVSNDSTVWVSVYDSIASDLGKELQNFDFADVEIQYVKFLAKGNQGSAWNSVSEFQINHIEVPPVIEPPPVVEPPISDCTDCLYKIIRQGRYQVIRNGVQDGIEHNEFTKAIEHGLQLKALNPLDSIVILPPKYRIE